MRAELGHEVSNAVAGYLCLLLHRRFELPGHQHSFEYYFFLAADKFTRQQEVKLMRLACFPPATGV